jgi:hypothetical protein
MEKTSIEEKYHQLWVHQLIEEFEDICAGYGVGLDIPVFEITGAEQQLGGWSSATKTLRLSSKLIEEYPWSVIIQVLKHEMAHLICSELFGEPQGGHGPYFQKACSLLGVLDDFRSHKIDLKDHLKGLKNDFGLGRGGRKLLEKVEKLLALGRSSNAHEAELALQKAHELMEKYQLAGLLETSDRVYSIAVINRKKKQIATYQKYICTILKDFFYVHPVLSYQYDPLLDTSFKVIELLGTKENVAIAEYCYDFLENQLSSLWVFEKKRGQGSGRRQKNSYYLGVVQGFHQKMQDQKVIRQKGAAKPKQ